MIALKKRELEEAVTRKSESGEQSFL